jgi:hypothetical protein
LLVGVTAVLMGVTVANSLVLMVPITDPASPVLALRDALGVLGMAVSWISPFAYLERVVDGVLAGAWWSAGVSLAAAIAYTAVMIGLAALWLRRRGVHRKGE